jgi:hypothetical protein
LNCRYPACASAHSNLPNAAGLDVPLAGHADARAQSTGNWLSAIMATGDEGLAPSATEK